MARRPLKKAARDPKAINRIGGKPIGIGVDNWPRIHNPDTDADQPMIHVLTIATTDIDAQAPDGVVALALFASSTEMPMYFDDPTADYDVVQLKQSDIDKGELDGPELPEKEMSAHGLAVGKGSAKSNFVGGSPRYIQEDGGSQGFVLQLNEGLVSLNLGDSGELYMFTNWAMWQSC